MSFQFDETVRIVAEVMNVLRQGQQWWIALQLMEKMHSSKVLANEASTERISPIQYLFIDWISDDIAIRGTYGTLTIAAWYHEKPNFPAQSYYH